MTWLWLVVGVIVGGAIGAAVGLGNANIAVVLSLINLISLLLLTPLDEQEPTDE